MQAFRWSGPGTFQLLGTLANFSRSRGNGVSGDGSIVVGESFEPTGEFGQAFRWTPGGGMQGLGYLRPGADTYSTAQAVSRDGSTIVGWSHSAGLGRSDAFRWTAGGGMQALPGLDASPSSLAYGVNFDGSIVVGYAGLGRAVMWRNGQAINLGAPAGWRSAVAQCVNDAGSVVGGWGYDGVGAQLACAWTPATGMVPLADYLTSNGVTIPTGWRLADCTGISANGRTFVGRGADGSFSQGFIATVPSPGSLSVAIVGMGLAFRRRRTFPPQSSPLRAPGPRGGSMCWRLGAPLRHPRLTGETPLPPLGREGSWSDDGRACGALRPWPGSPRPGSRR